MYHILIKDDYTIYSKGISEILKSHFSNTNIAEVSLKVDLLEKANQENWDVIIVDIEDPEKGDFTLLKNIKKANPKASIIVTTHTDNPLLTTAIKTTGASAYLTKSCTEEDFIATIENAIDLANKSKTDYC